MQPDRREQGAAGWTEVRVDVPLGWQELVAEQFAAAPFTGAVLGEPTVGAGAAGAPPEGFDALRAYCPAAADTPALRAAVADGLASLADRAGAAELAGLAAAFRRLPPEDYANSWKKSWRPFRVGRLCVVAPGWSGAARPGDLRLELEPGGTFGTGRHATTRTCLRVLQERVEPGQRVLDAGTGTGIQTVAAALLGATHGVGFDVDPSSRPAARELARRNGVEPRCEFREGGFEVLDERNRDFDGLVANLYSDLIQRHAAELAARLRAGGWFAVSGCPVHHREPTRAALEAAGLVVERELATGRWHTFEGRRDAAT